MGWWWRVAALFRAGWSPAGIFHLGVSRYNNPSFDHSISWCAGHLVISNSLHFHSVYCFGKNPGTLEGTSHHPAFLSNCPTISHMFLALSTKWMNSPPRKWRRGVSPTYLIVLCFVWIKRIRRQREFKIPMCIPSGGNLLRGCYKFGCGWTTGAWNRQLQAGVQGRGWDFIKL